MDAAFFTDIDVEVLAVQPPPSDDEIVAELLEMEDVSNGNNNAIETEDTLSRSCKNSSCF